MADEPKVSAVMAVRNGERFIVECLASLRSQTLPLHELVIVDDASTDATPDLLVAERAHAPYPVTVLRQERSSGHSRAFEHALSAVTGDIVINCDHDDISEPIRAAATAELLGPDKPPAAVFTDASLIDAHGGEMGTLWKHSGLARVAEDLHDPANLGRLLLRRGVVWGATIAFDVRLVPLLRPFPEWASDTWIAMVANAMARLIADPRPVVRYRIHSDNLAGITPRNPVKALRYMGQRPDFHVLLHRFYNELSAHLRRLGADADVVAATEAKAAHLATRNARSARLLPRIAQVSREMARGGYRRYSPGLQSVVYDILVAPAVPPSLVPEAPGR